MKTVILAGGFGTRLGERTNYIPKPLVKIGGKPILWHIMKIYAYYGFHDFVICLGYKGEQIKRYFLDFCSLNSDVTINTANGDLTFHNDQFEDWNVTLVSTGIETLKGGRVKRIEPYLGEGANFLTYGDGVANIDINDLREFHFDHNQPVTVTGTRPPARFGEIKEEGNRVVSFKEKSQTTSGWINGGFMVFDEELLNHLTTDKNCDLEVGTLEDLSCQGKVMVYKHEGDWQCMDHERDVKRLRELWQSDEAFWKIW